MGAGCLLASILPLHGFGSSSTLDASTIHIQENDMGYIIWTAFTTIIGGFIGNALEQPYLGIGLGAIFGLVTSMLVSVGSGGELVADTISDAFDD